MSDMKKTGFLLKRINSFIIFTFPSITNVVRRCALQLLMYDFPHLLKGGRLLHDGTPHGELHSL